jgi:hypothetical protein
MFGPQKTEWELISPVITRIHAEGGLGIYMNREEDAEKKKWGLFGVCLCGVVAAA